MSNISGSSGQRLYICDFYTNDEANSVNILNAVINLVFSVSAILGNALILVAIRRTTSLWLPTKILLSSLAFADIGVGLLAQPFSVVKMFLQDKISRCVIGVLFDFLSGHLSIASFTTMMLISLDKCLAAQLKLRYRIVVTRKRTILAVSFIWAFAIPLAISFFVNVRVYGIFVITIIPACFSVSLAAFAKIRLVLRRQGTRYATAVSNRATTSTFQGERERSFSNTSRYRSSVRSMLYVYCAQVIAYCPAWIVMLIRTISGLTTPAIQVATKLTLTFIFVNSTVNPVLYLWRIKELRTAAAEVIPFLFKSIRVDNRASTPSEDRIEYPRTKTFVECIEP